MVYAGQQKERTSPATNAAEHTVSNHQTSLSVGWPNHMASFTPQRTGKRFGAKAYNAEPGAAGGAICGGLAQDGSAAGEGAAAARGADDDCRQAWPVGAASAQPRESVS